MMKKQLSNREKGLDEKIEELREQCEDQSENVDQVSKQLLELNKGNLKKTYVLEDLQHDYDVLTQQEQDASTFLTNSFKHNRSQKALKPQRESYASIARAAQGG